MVIIITIILYTTFGQKPDRLLDREVEWARLTAFVADARPGPLLALLYGRRRPGKTLLLELLPEAAL